MRTRAYVSAVLRAGRKPFSLLNRWREFGKFGIYVGSLDSRETKIVLNAHRFVRCFFGPNKSIVFTDGEDNSSVVSATAAKLPKKSAFLVRHSRRGRCSFQKLDRAQSDDINHVFEAISQDLSISLNPNVQVLLIGMDVDESAFSELCERV